MLPRSRQSTRPTRACRRRGAAVLLTTLGLACAGCSREQPAGAGASTSGDAPAVAVEVSTTVRSPIETLRALHAARWSGRYSAMQELIVPEQRDAVVSLVLAVDQLIAAENNLQQTLRATIGEGSAQRYRQRTQVANIIGPLSRDVRWISEHLDGAHAVVMMQVADRIPLERVELTQSPTGWLVQTDKPIPGLAEALGELAAVTRRFAAEVQRNRFEATAIERELTLRQTPVLRRIAHLTAEARGEGD